MRSNTASKNFHQNNEGGFVMKIKVLLTSIITLITIAIISGCGGGSDTTQPASLITPTPNYTDTGDMAYLTVRVKWPANGKSGSMSTVSENGKELTGSLIPNGTKIIDIYVIDYSETPTSGEVPWGKVVAAGNIHEGEIEKTFPIPVAAKVIGKPTPGAPDQGSTGPPPAILVKIFAEAFSEFDEEHPKVRNHNKQVAHTDINVEPVPLRFGNQEHRIRLLLNPIVKVEAYESETGRSIIASDTGSSNEYDINANLLLMYGTPFPVSTPKADTSGETSEPMEGQEIKFKVIEGSGTLDADQAQTDLNGNCAVHFTRASAYNVIEASYQYDPDDPNTIIASLCTIGDNYELTVDPNSIILNLPPLFKRNANIGPLPTATTPGGSPTPGSGGSNSVNITAKLNIVYPTPAPNSTATPKPPKPAEGKLIKFEIIEGNDGGTYLSLAGETGSIVSGFTLADGSSTATLTTITAGYKTIKAYFQADSNDPNSIYSDKCYVTVIQPLPTSTPGPTSTPAATSTPKPTATSTPLPIPPYRPYIVGKWEERDWNSKLTGRSYTIEVTQPVDRGADRIPRIWMGIIVTDENGQTYKGWVVTPPWAPEIDGIQVLYIGDGVIYDDSDYFPGYHIIEWGVGKLPWTKK
jgi:hypothetical protein